MSNILDVLMQNINTADKLLENILFEMNIKISEIEQVIRTIENKFSQYYY